MRSSFLMVCVCAVTLPSRLGSVHFSNCRMKNTEMPEQTRFLLGQKPVSRACPGQQAGGNVDSGEGAGGNGTDPSEGSNEVGQSADQNGTDQGGGNNQTGQDAGGNASGLSEMLEEVLKLTNEERASVSLEPLCLNRELGKAAQLHSEDQKSSGKMSHSGSDGSQPADRATAQSYKFKGVAENVAQGQKTAAEVMKSWMNSPPHKKNILGSDFKNIGLGLQDGYWTQVFGTLRSGEDGCNQ